MDKELKMRLARVGREVNRKMAECEKHGAYDSVARYHTSGKVVWSGCEECLKERLSQPDTSHKDAMQRRLERAGIKPLFKNATVANYSPKSRSQHVAKQVINSFGKSFGKTGDDSSGLVVTGETGVGKTYLCSGLVKGLTLAGFHVRLASTMEVIREIRKSYSDRNLDEGALLSSYAKLDLLIIDEIGIQNGTASEMTILFEIINQRSENLRPTILVSNLDPEKVAEFLTQRVYRRVLGENGIALKITKAA